MLISYVHLQQQFNTWIHLKDDKEVHVQSIKNAAHTNWVCASVLSHAWKLLHMQY